jgi:C4-dicarboxylate-specific signal transduction histidine kinase
MLFNVIKNAAEAVKEKGDGAVFISIGDGASGFTKITVRDNGTGVTPETLERMNTPFFTTKEDGSGLGLYISRTIAAEHGGDLSISCKEGEGCSIEISLPVV